jgi:transposase InsO family protein
MLVHTEGEEASVSEVCTAAQIARTRETTRDLHRPRQPVLKRTQRRIKLRHILPAGGIKHIFGGIGKPTTLGKIERWFRTYDLEHTRFQLHSKFVEYYSYERPHMALNYKTPGEVYFRDVPRVMI